YDLALKVLKAKNPLAIGLPLVFSDNEDCNNNLTFIADTTVVFGAFYYKDFEKIIGPNDNIKCTYENFGILNISLDSDGHLRKLSPLFLNINNKSYDHFVVKLAKKINSSIYMKDNILFIDSISGKKKISDNNFYINYYSPVLKQNIEQINYMEFYERFILKNNVESLKDYIIIIGVDVPGYSNYWKTSDLNYNNSNSVLAAALLNFLSGDIIVKAPYNSTLFIIIFISLLTSLIFYFKLDSHISKKNTMIFLIVFFIFSFIPYFIYYIFLLKLDYLTIYVSLFCFPLLFGLLRFLFYSNELNNQCIELNTDLEEKLKTIEKLQSIRNDYIEQISMLSTDVKSYENKFSTNTKYIQNLSHELKNPLAPIMGYSNLLKNESEIKNNPHIYNCIESIERNAKRIGVLLNKIKYISLIENNKLKINIETINLKGFFETIINEYIQNKKISCRREISIKFDLSNQEYVEADMHLLEQIFINIFDNSYKYSDPESPLNILVSTGSSDEYIEFKIEDFGWGLSIDNPEEILARFYRDSDDKKNGVTGDGIGLNIVNEIIKLHNGKISIYNKGINKGIIVTLKFPRTTCQS
ncbi:CHASE2 domain-containing protein, partial [Candidatus Dependentiae bacterium]|nr:CHASE2 domain-containing protein [Candidatus Dependentiae bacterium]